MFLIHRLKKEGENGSHLRFDVLKMTLFRCNLTQLLHE